MRVPGSNPEALCTLGTLAPLPVSLAPLHSTLHIIAAVFCMCNRCVDGLATWAPEDPDFYRARAAVIAEHGYTSSTVALPQVQST
jgi:hypothetical protein